MAAAWIWHRQTSFILSSLRVEVAHDGLYFCNWPEELHFILLDADGRGLEEILIPHLLFAFGRGEFEVFGSE
jgi:hypothetical protein